MTMNGLQCVDRFLTYVSLLPSSWGLIDVWLDTIPDTGLPLLWHHNSQDIFKDFSSLQFFRIFPHTNNKTDWLS